MPPARSRILRVFVLGAGVLAGALGSGAAALAEPDREEPIRLTYQATSRCPDEADFVARIRARTTGARLAWPGEDARTFDVTMDAGPPATGSVTVVKADRSAGARRVQADTCADVADALALVIALSIDPGATPAPAAPPPAAAALPGAIEPPPSLPVHAADEVQETHSPAGSRGDVFAGADLAVTFGAAPSALVGGSPYVGWRANAAGVVDPSVRLALVRGASDTHPAPTGSADFIWTAARLDACPAEWAHGLVRLTTCARLEAGALAVAAGGVGAPETRVRPWFALGLLARAEWSFLRPMFLDAEIGALVRATNDRFYFLPDTTVYQVPAIGASGGVGLGVHFL